MSGKIIQNEQNIAIVWLDVSFETSNQASPTIKQLQTITNDVMVYNDLDSCIDYITDLKDKCVLLIVSDFVSQDVFTCAQDLSAILFLYILCSSENKQWTESIRKIKGIFNNMDELIKQMKTDIYYIEHNLIGLEVVNISNVSAPFSKDLNKQEYSFMRSQLLKNVFLKFQDNSTLELVEYCRTIYADNPAQLTIINEFERDYDENKAIEWYTRNTFLYKLVNHALRTLHVETLYNMRTFIRHMHQQLTKLFIKDSHTLPTSNLTLYRGLKMPIDEFNKLEDNKGGLLSISSFLSTSKSKDVAIIFAGESDHETKAVLFQITVNLDRDINTAFARIEHLSHIGKGEQEWLFSMGTIFRIGNIELLDRIWYIQLTLTNDQDEILEKLTVHMSKIIQIERDNPLVPLCRLLARMNEYNKAIELCEKHARLENGWEMKATFYDTRAIIEVEKKQDDTALYFHQKALNIVKKYVDKNDPILASYYNNAAISYEVKCKDKKAFDHYQMATTLELRTLQPDYTSIAYAYESMGHILYKVDKEYDEAISYYHQALQLMLVHLPPTHLDIISVYSDMANIYQDQNKLDDALSMLDKCLALQQNSRQCIPDDLILTCKHKAKIYTMQKKFEQASLMMDMCEKLERIGLSSKDITLKNIDIDALSARILQSYNN